MARTDDLNLDEDLHDAFRLMYDGVDVAFALDAAYAEEDEEIPLDSIAPELEVVPQPGPVGRLTKQAVLPRSRIRSVFDAALDADDAHRRPTYGYKKARILDAYRRVEQLDVPTGVAEAGHGADAEERKRMMRKKQALRSLLKGQQRASDPASSASERSAPEAAVSKLRQLLGKRRGAAIDGSTSTNSPAASTYPYAPFSVEAYHRRLLTFSARSWSTKYKLSTQAAMVAAVAQQGGNAEDAADTDPLRAAEAARHGWIGASVSNIAGAGQAAKANVLHCACCGVKWAVGCNVGELGGLKQEWIDKVVLKTAEQYVLAHAESCPWRRLQSPPTIYNKLLPTYHPLLSRRLARIAQDIDWQCLTQAAGDLQLKSPLNDTELDNLQRNLAAALEEDTDVAEGPTAPAEGGTCSPAGSAMSLKSAAFAFFGWTPSAQHPASGLLRGSLECKLCNGGRFLSTDLRGETGPLDLLRRHSDHCPIVATQVADRKTNQRQPWWYGQALLQTADWTSDEEGANRLQARMQEDLNSL